MSYVYYQCFIEDWLYDMTASYTQLLYRAWGRLKNSYELLNLRALKFSQANKIHIFQSVGKIFCVKSFEIPHKISYP